MNDFFSKIYEFFYYQSADDFSVNVFDFELYGILGILTIILSLVTMAIYYYAINSTKFNQWYHWLLILGVNALVNFSTVYFYTKSVFSEEGIDTNISFFMLFGLVNVLFASIYFIASSFAFRRWSTNCSVSPF